MPSLPGPLILPSPPFHRIRLCCPFRSTHGSGWWGAGTSDVTLWWRQQCHRKIISGRWSDFCVVKTDPGSHLSRGGSLAGATGTGQGRHRRLKVASLGYMVWDDARDVRSTGYDFGLVRRRTSCVGDSCHINRWFPNVCEGVKPHVRTWALVCAMRCFL